jgi:O-antigen/teichoic acid export membrane protein
VIRPAGQARGMYSAVTSTAAVKIGVMGFSGVLGIINSRLIIQHFGTAAYAQYGLLSALPALLPFADLGIGAVVINAVASASSPSTDEKMRRAIVTAFRILLISGAAIIAIGLVITLCGWWPVLLGGGLIANGGSIAAFICIAIFGLALPLAVGTRILVGLHKTNTQVAAQAIAYPFMILSILALVAFSVPAGSYLSILTYIASALASIVCLIVAGRIIRPQLGRAVSEIFHPRRFPGSKGAIGVAWPMLAQMLALPIALQTDRLLLSHLTDGTQLAQYNLAAQIFGIAIQTIGAAGLAFWPIFARARAENRIQSPFVPMLWFTSGGLLLSLVLAAVTPWLSGFISGGKVQLSPWLIVGFVAYAAFQGANYPLGMYMTDKRGLTFQVWPILVSVPLNLALSWYLVGVIGAGGPIVGSAISVGLCQVLPNVWYVRHNLAVRRREVANGSAPQGSPEEIPEAEQLAEMVQIAEIDDLDR